MTLTPAEPWLDELRKHVGDKPFAILRLSESDSEQLFTSRLGLREFTIARAHDLCRDIKASTLCLVFGRLGGWGFRDEEPQDVAYLGLITSRGRVTTLETRLKVKRGTSIVPENEGGLAALMPAGTHASILRKKLESDANLLLLSPKLSEVILRVLLTIPQNQQALRQLSESLTTPKRYSGFSAFQEDAVQTALMTFGIAARDRAERVDIVGRRETALARIPLREDSVIEHDARTVPGYTLVSSDITGRAFFEKGTEQLEVFTANRRDLEYVFGVDLIYLNLTKHNLVMVQYKMLEPNGRRDGVTDWIYRPDDNMAEEMSRMKQFSAQHLPAPGEYRLNPGVFYLKFVKRNGLLSNGSIITSIDHYETLLHTPACLGQSGGIRVSYNALAGRYIRQGSFTDLIQSGYIGAYAQTTDAFKTLVKEVLDGNRAVVAAVQSMRSECAAYLQDIQSTHRNDR